MDHDQKLSHFARVFGEVEDAAPLYLGLLLHDIGKGRGKGHVPRGVRIAERVCERLQLDRQVADPVIFLVRHHLLMSHTAQRRDTADEDLLEEFVTTVGSVERLNMLLLLTYADIRGVGPQVWNDWKGTLLWELYARARSHFTGGRPVRWDTNHKMSIKQQVIRELLPNYMPSDVWKHFAMMPERYLRATDPDQMVRHFRLINQMGDEPLLVEWRVPEGNHCTELTVCTRDRQGLFAQLAGTLTASGINILSADVYTREDGIVVDTLKVCEISGSHSIRSERTAKTQKNLKAAIDGGYDVAAAVEQWRAKLPRPRRRAPRSHSRPKVRFNSEASATNTVVEVQAEDEPGLAYKIANTLAELSVNIMLAKITTEKSHALDIFYVTDSNGRKLDKNQISEVGAALIGALGGPTKEPL
jgi:[protein-PII] uridylyltransferase